MKIHHIRNATLIIQSKDKYILVDPMLSQKGELPPFSRIKHKVQKNPTVELPKNTNDLLEKVTIKFIFYAFNICIIPLLYVSYNFNIKTFKG